MTPRPLHRWKSFWFGIFILISLGWLWSWGRTHSDSAAARLGKQTWHGIVSSDGLLHWYQETTRPGTIHSRNFSFNSHTTQVQRWFPQPPIVTGHLANPPSTVTYVGIAHWLLILLFLLPWSAFLIWRRRRMSRLLDSPSPS
ncbi:MAG: hypothetical protein EOP87_25235 [Verrucomicrobiaceae bacterium]|nr:MAG: hypothetical protein EOP87_25235 [Verrucomicrobiaceae bacterium]